MVLKTNFFCTWMPTYQQDDSLRSVASHSRFPNNFQVSWWKTINLYKMIVSLKNLIKAKKNNEMAESMNQIYKLLIFTS